jgi:hypothetical protein
MKRKMGLEVDNMHCLSGGKKNIHSVNSLSVR